MTSSDETTALQSLERRLGYMEDVEAVRSLIRQYAFYCDNGYDADGLAGLFTDDAVWHSNHFGTYRGREAIREFTAGNQARIPWAFHAMVNERVEVDSSGGSGTAHWNLIEFATMAAPDRGSAPDAVVMTAKYDAPLVKRDGLWKFHRMDVHFHQISKWDRGWVVEPFRES